MAQQVLYRYGDGCGRSEYEYRQARYNKQQAFGTRSWLLGRHFNCQSAFAAFIAALVSRIKFIFLAAAVINNSLFAVFDVLKGCFACERDEAGPLDIVLWKSPRSCY